MVYRKNSVEILKVGTVARLDTKSTRSRDRPLPRAIEPLMGNFVHSRQRISFPHGDGNAALSGLGHVPCPGKGWAIENCMNAQYDGVRVFDNNTGLKALFQSRKLPHTLSSCTEQCAKPPSR